MKEKKNFLLMHFLSYVSILNNDVCSVADHNHCANNYLMTIKQKEN
jgi:hypothetical protein